MVYADYIALIMMSKEEHWNAVTEWVSATREKGLRININKSKVIVIAKQVGEKCLNVN